MLSAVKKRMNFVSTCILMTIVCLSIHLSGETTITDSSPIVTIHQIANFDSLQQLMTHRTNIFLFVCVGNSEGGEGVEENTHCQGGNNFMDRVVNVVGAYQQTPVRGFSFGIAKATSDSDIAKFYQLSQFPSVLYVRKNQAGETHITQFTVDMNDEDTDETFITMWMRDNARSFLQNLSEESFEHLTQASSGATTGDWLVLFAPAEAWRRNGPLRLALDTISAEYKHQLSVAIVDTEANEELVKRMKVPTTSPSSSKGTKDFTLRYYRLEKMYYYNFASISHKALRSFVTGGFRHVKSEKVPAEPTPWDKFIEGVVLSLKEFGYPSFVGPFILFLAFTAAMSILIILACCASRRDKDQDTKFKKG